MDGASPSVAALTGCIEVCASPTALVAQVIGGRHTLGRRNPNVVHDNAFWAGKATCRRGLPWQRVMKVRRRELFPDTDEIALRFR